jgi:hypothetical protein
MNFRVLRRSVSILVAGLVLAAPSLSQMEPKLTVRDKSELVQTILNQFFKDYPDAIDADEVVLSSRNLPRTFTSNASRPRVRLLSPGKIKLAAEDKGFLDYLVFSGFKVRDSTVFVTFESIRLTTFESKIIPFFGHGFMWEARKRSGRWDVECVNTSAFSTNLETTRYR